MSASVTMLPGYEWSRAPLDLMAALNATANPTGRVDELAVGTRELVAADIVAIATALPHPAPITFTVPSDTVVAAFGQATLGTVGFSGGVIGDFILVSQPNFDVQVDALILSSGLATIIARAPSAIGTTVLNGTVYKLRKV